jgi:hypothetical protein
MREQIEFSALRPDPLRTWYRHCFGLRGFVWSVHGSFERVYYFDPDYVLGELSHLLPQTVISLAAVIESELEAAIDQPMKPEHAARVNAFLRDRPIWIGERLQARRGDEGKPEASGSTPAPSE